MSEEMGLGLQESYLEGEILNVVHRALYRLQRRLIPARK